MEKKFDKQNNKGCKASTSNKRSRNNETKSTKSAKYAPKYSKFKDGDNAEIPDENDYTFYSPDEQIAKDAASIPFNYIGGARYKLGMHYEGYNTKATEMPKPLKIDVEHADALVTAADIRYVPSIGITDNINKGVNMAFRQLYAYIRKANSGAKNYEVPDLGAYVLAMEDIYRAFFECKRDYGMYDRYNYFNHNIPFVFAACSRFQYDDLVANAANYRRRLNSIALRINSYAIPKYFNSFKRKAFISSYIFSDSTSPRGQFYLFNAAGHYEWSPRTSQQGTELVYKHHDSEEVITLGDKLDRLEAMLEAITQDEDATTISGDILKAFPESELYILSMTDENYFTEIVYDENVLGQIENMVFLCADEDEFERFETVALRSNETPNEEEFDFNITQRNQLIISKPHFVVTPKVKADYAYGISNTDYVFNSHKDNPDYRDVLEWSRLMTRSSYTITSKETDDELKPYITTMDKQVDSCGLEIPLTMIVYQGHYDNDKGFSYKRSIINQILVIDERTTNGANEQEYLQHLKSSLTLMQMDWHPVIYMVNIGSNLTRSPIYLGFDSKVTTIIHKDVLDRINDTAIYGCYYAKSLFNPTK